MTSQGASDGQDSPLDSAVAQGPLPEASGDDEPGDGIVKNVPDSTQQAEDAPGAAPTECERADVAAVYERYLTRCNEHRFDELGEFVSERVSGSGAADGLAAYISRLKGLCRAFPDYRWELQQTVVQQDTLAARLTGHGTHTGAFGGIAGTGRRISTQELVIYRFHDGKIVQCWGDLFPVVRDALTALSRSTT